MHIPKTNKKINKQIKRGEKIYLIFYIAHL